MYAVFADKHLKLLHKIFTQKLVDGQHIVNSWHHVQALCDTSFLTRLSDSPPSSWEARTPNWPSCKTAQTMWIHARMCLL